MTVHLWKLRLDARAVAELGREQKLLHRQVDDGYLVHAALRAACGERAPTPFAIERMLSASSQLPPTTEVVLALAPRPFRRDDLSPDYQHLIDIGESRPVPAQARGTRLGFVVRATPVVRTRRPVEPDAPLRPRGKSREVDAFLAEVGRVDPENPVDRAAVYRGWLASQLASHGDAVLEDFSLRAFRRIRLLRKESAVGGSRKRHVVERPDAVMSGTLTVGDPERFDALLARGVGRHRAFGFGMVLVRPMR